MMVFKFESINVCSLRLGYVLIDRTPLHITRLEARKQGLALIYDNLIGLTLTMGEKSKLGSSFTEK